MSAATADESIAHARDMGHNPDRRWWVPTAARFPDGTIDVRTTLADLDARHNRDAATGPASFDRPRCPDCNQIVRYLSGAGLSERAAAEIEDRAPWVCPCGASGEGDPADDLATDEPEGPSTSARGVPEGGRGAEGSTRYPSAPASQNTSDPAQWPAQPGGVTNSRSKPT